MLNIIEKNRKKDEKNEEWRGLGEGFRGRKNEEF